MRKLLPRLQSLLHSRALQYAQYHARVLEQSLKDTRHLYDVQLAATQQQRRELHYLYALLPQRVGEGGYECRMDGRGRLVLLRTVRDQYGVELVLHRPAAQLEIAAIYAHAVGPTLQLDDMDIRLDECDAATGKLLLQALAGQARLMKLADIRGHISHKQPDVLAALGRFYTQAGFAVSPTENALVLAMVYSIAPVVIRK